MSFRYEENMQKGELLRMNKQICWLGTDKSSKFGSGFSVMPSFWRAIMDSKKGLLFPVPRPNGVC